MTGQVIFRKDPEGRLGIVSKAVHWSNGAHGLPALDRGRFRLAMTVRGPCSNKQSVTETKSASVHLRARRDRRR